MGPLYAATKCVPSTAVGGGASGAATLTSSLIKVRGTAPLSFGKAWSEPYDIVLNNYLRLEIQAIDAQHRVESFLKQPASN